MNEIINSCQFVGNVGKDPELQYLPSGSAILKFSICVNMTTRKDDTYGKEPLWVDLVAFGKRAEGWAKILKKGTKVAVNCQYQKRQYQTPEGQNRYSHDFQVRELELLSGGRSRDEAASDDTGESNMSPLPAEMPF